MMEYFEILIETLVDCGKLVPFLYATLFLMEYIEHRASGRLVDLLRRSGRLGPVVGAALGCIPQCGFSAACAELFNGGLITAGTLVAVFISTTDEALPILIAQPDRWGVLLQLIAAQAVIAIITGFALDALWRIPLQNREYAEHAEKHVCASDNKLHNIAFAAFLRMLSILLFLFLVTLALNLLIHFIGEERLAALMLPGAFQPLVAALIGLIPNCAASVLITRLYLGGLITFGSTVAGLSSAAGIGLMVLLHGKRSPRAYLIVIGTTFVSSVLFGSLLQLVR